MLLLPELLLLPFRTRFGVRFQLDSEICGAIFTDPAPDKRQKHTDDNGLEIISPLLAPSRQDRT